MSKNEDCNKGWFYKNGEQEIREAMTKEEREEAQKAHCHIIKMYYLYSCLLFSLGVLGEVYSNTGLGCSDYSLYNPSFP